MGLSSRSVTLPRSWTLFVSTQGSNSLVGAVAEVVSLAIPTWLYDIYQNAYVDTLPATVLTNTRHIRKCMQQRFIAYIVTLTHVMETLSILTDHKTLTRRAIKAACGAYHDSSLMTRTRVCIQGYRELDGRDVALEMIEDLIKPERYGDLCIKNFYAEINKRDLGKQNLDEDEEW